MIVTFGRVLATGIRNFIRNSWLTIAATAVMVVTITIVLLAFVLNVTAKNAISELGKNLKVSVFLVDDVSADSRLALESELRDNQYVATVEYVSKEKAQIEFEDSFAGEEKIIEGLALVGGGILPESIRISLNDVSKMAEVANIARADKYAQIVDDVSLGSVEDDAQATIDRAAAAKSFILRSSVIAATIFTGVSILIIFNTIRMAIFTRSEEIQIMKLLGATSGYIRGPFLVESALYGLIAGSISASVVYTIVISLGGRVAEQAEFAETYRYFLGNGTMTLMFGGAVIGAVLVSMLSSVLAMERYLRLRRW